MNLHSVKNNLAQFFSGEILYGDDFSQSEISEWYKDEAEGYAELGSGNRDKYKYGYHACNWYYGYRYLRNEHFKNALGLGSAYGDEFIPISNKIRHITIVDSSKMFVVADIKGTPVSYIEALETGTLPFNDNYFDLVTCFGVLHHIPNVSYVVKEMYRCTNHGGKVLVREPVTSMGDWRKPRKGLTKRERGIPSNILNDTFQETGFKIEEFSYCFFPLTPRIWNIFGIAPYNNIASTLFDYWLSKAFSWNYSYHRQSVLSKFAPTNTFWVLRK